MAATAGDLVLRLDQVSRGDIALTGVKSANLGELAHAGFPVPDGFVLTTGAFDAFLTANALVQSSMHDKVAQAALPSDVKGALLAAAGALGDAPLAVRSSGVAEDLAGTSFAGQYETVLDVRGADALIAAVQKCWASVFSERVGQYRAARGQSVIPGMAVLIQHMVKADAAGVAFTANPVTGDDEVVVSAVRGVGERLVSGRASPDEWVVRGTEAICQRCPEGALGPDEVKTVAELARQVEAHFRAPQDIEWAVADGKVYLLQARPITALPQKPNLKIPEKGYWMKDSSHFPSPLTPFGASVYLPAIEHATGVMCRELGIPLERIENRAIGGEVYAHAVPLGGKEGPAPPSWVIFLASRLAPPFRRCTRIAQEVLRSGLIERLTERWYGEWRGQFRQEAKDLLSRSLAKMDDGALLQHLDEALDLMRRGQELHFRLFGPYVFGLYELIAVCEEALGWDTAKTISLLSGLSETSSEPARKLAELAMMIRQSTAARNVMVSGSADVIGQLRQAAPSVAEAFEAYLDEYGHRAVNYEPGSPTLAERPELLVSVLQGMTADDRPTAILDLERARQKAIADARAEMARRSAQERQRFERSLAVAERVYPMREDNIFYTDTVPNGVIHYAVIEVGRRLASRGALNSAEDAVYLEDTELRAALNDKLENTASIVERRKAERAWVAAHPGPAAYGKDPGPPPDPKALPEPLRTLLKVQIWYMAQGMPSARATANTDEKIAGVPGSPGRFTGTVRIVRDENEFTRLRRGDVLVCPITTPTWSVLFAQAGAVVTDGGGVLAHAAIIAREHGIPAVLGTGDATRRLRDGQTVTVDGATGIVQVQSENSSAAGGRTSP